MTKEDFVKLETDLLKKGYKKYLQSWHREDYCLFKGYDKHNNPWEEDRCTYQIGLSIYDYSIHPEYWDRMPTTYRNYVGIEIHVDVSRIIDESMELEFSWKEGETTIEGVENKAKSFYDWVCNECPITIK